MQYNQWHVLFLNTMGKYALTDHVNLDATLTDDADWDAMECTARSWTPPSPLISSMMS
jgi:hypothetical protein